MPKRKKRQQKSSPRKKARVDKMPSFVLEYEVATAQGSRPHQEDTFSIKTSTVPLFCVFDGHGTNVASSHARDHLPDHLINLPNFKSKDYRKAISESFAREDDELKKLEATKMKEKMSGCTATVAIVDKDKSSLVVGNVGDSRCIMGRLSSDGKSLEAVRLSIDHNLNRPEEQKRVAASGAPVHRGRIFDQDQSHSINMTKALGDFDLKKPETGTGSDFVSAIPHVESVMLDKSVKLLILASDGLWDIFTDQALVDLIYKHLPTKSVKDICHEITNGVAKKPNSDNVTVILVLFKWDAETKSAQK